MHTQQKYFHVNVSLNIPSLLTMNFFFQVASLDKRENLRQLLVFRKQIPALFFCIKWMNSIFSKYTYILTGRKYGALWVTFFPRFCLFNQRNSFLKLIQRRNYYKACPFPIECVILVEEYFHLQITAEIIKIQGINYTLIKPNHISQDCFGSMRKSLSPQQLMRWL